MVLQDRITGTKYELIVSDGQFGLSESTSGARPEPILKDKVVVTNYWKLFISDGQIGIESSSQGDTSIIIKDSVQVDVYWLLEVNDGQLAIETTVPPVIVVPIAGATGSGIQSKYRRLTKALYEFNIDGAKAFPVLHHIELFGQTLHELAQIIEVRAKKLVSVARKLNVAGTKLSDFKRSSPIKGTLQTNLDKPLNVSAIKRTKIDTGRVIHATRLIPNKYEYGIKANNQSDFAITRFTRDMPVFAITQTKLELSNSITGKRDVTPILETLDLLGDEE